MNRKCRKLRLYCKIWNFRIKITFNVNHTVDTEVLPKVDSNMDEPEFGELKSKPAFKVEITRGSTTLSVFCSFMESDEQEGGTSKS